MKGNPTDGVLLKEWIEPYSSAAGPGHRMEVRCMKRYHSGHIKEFFWWRLLGTDVWRGPVLRRFDLLIAASHEIGLSAAAADWNKDA